MYWIVNLVNRSIEVYSDPDAGDAKSAYRTPRVFREGEKVPVEIADRKIGEISVADILP